jgi:hypothetical protein
VNPATFAVTDTFMRSNHIRAITFDLHVVQYRSSRPPHHIRLTQPCLIVSDDILHAFGPSYDRRCLQHFPSLRCRKTSSVSWRMFANRSDTSMIWSTSNTSSQFNVTTSCLHGSCSRKDVSDYHPRGTGKHPSSAQSFRRASMLRSNWRTLNRT